MSDGAYYWEIRVVMGDDEINGGGVGVLDLSVNLGDAYIGAGTSGLSFGYAGFTQYYTGWSTVNFPSGNPPEACFADTGKIYMFALDVDSGRLWVGNDGVWYNGGDPAMNLNPAATGLPIRLFAGATLYDNGSVAYQANFMGPFQFPVPAGFRAGLY